MSYRIRRVDYHYVTIDDEPGQAWELLSRLAELGVKLLAFTGMPLGPNRTQLTLVPEDSGTLRRVMEKGGLCCDGPHGALLVQGDDALGALADIHRRLSDARVDVYASTGITDVCGCFGYLTYVRRGELERAAAALEV